MKGATSFIVEISQETKQISIMTTEEKVKAYDEALERAMGLLEIVKEDKVEITEEDIKSLFPELAESEDERTRKKLVQFLTEVKNISESGRDSWAVRKEDAGMCDSFLSYLEKQKDAFENGRQLGIMQEQARQELGWPEPKEQKEQKSANNYLEWRNIVYYVLKEWLGIGQYMDMAPFNDIVKTLQERYSLPKSVEWSEEDEEALQEVKLNFELNHDDMTPTLVGFYERFFNKFKSFCPQSKVEWNEEDEKVRKMLVELVKKYLVNHERCMAESWLEKQKEQNLNSPQLKEQRPVSFNEPYTPDDYEVIMEGNATSIRRKQQKPEEWNKEDETHRNFILESLENQIRFCKKDAAGAYYAKQIRTAQNWLKCLRPQPCEEIYQAAKHDFAIKFMNYLDENRPEGKMSLSNDECEDIDKAFKENDWKKIMRYVEKYLPHWKPSKEQMNYLSAAVIEAKRKHNESVNGYPRYAGLKSLCEDLEKQCKKDEKI